MIGVVLAGGASRRFAGRPKGLLPLAGRPMVLRVADMLGAFCAHVAIEAPHGAGYETLGLPLIHAPAEHAGKGPLAGLAAGLALAQPDDRVAFAPCDMPFLTREMYDRLAQACDAKPGAYAVSPKSDEPLVAILGGTLRAALLETLALPDLPRTHKVLDAAGAVAVPFEAAAPFANINTPEDLAAAETALAHG